MSPKDYWNLIRGKNTDAINPAKLTIKNIWAVVQSWIRSVLPVPQHIKEQIVWRKRQVLFKSPECIRKGNCIQCGCEMKGKLKADIGCENPPFCYPEMMSKKKWKEFKSVNRQNQQFV